MIHAIAEILLSPHPRKTRSRRLRPRPIAWAAALAAGLTLGTALAASVAEDEYTHLQAQAKAKGSVAVTVHLVASTLDDLYQRKDVLKAQTDERAKALIAELGARVYPEGRWTNGIGQIGLLLTPEGLAALKESKTALSFFPGQEWDKRTLIADSEGALSAVEGLLNKQGWADVEVTLNVDGLAFDIDQTGRAHVVLSTQAQKAQAIELAGKVLGALGLADRSIGSSNQAATASQLAAADADQPALLRLRVTRRSLADLADNTAVRAIKPLGYRDERALEVDQELIDEVKSRGTARALIALKSPYVGGSTSFASNQGIIDSNEKLLSLTLNGLGSNAKVVTFPLTGGAAADVSLSDIRMLQTSGKGRLLRLSLNQVGTTTGLSQSASTINAPTYWSLGYRGQGQTIVVIDSGLPNSHAFFKNSAGNSRVTFEACFGTTNATGWQSPCPSPDSNGDSPPGLTGSAAPITSSFCPGGQADSQCNHGTHVAGIAAGRAHPNVGNGSLQGIAPDASIAAIQVFSYRSSGALDTTVHDEDLWKAVETLAVALPPTGTPLPYTLNLSLQHPGRQWAQPCGGVYRLPFTNAIASLNAAGIPVIAINGNFGSVTGPTNWDRLTWPACEPKAIKVGAVVNDGAGTTVPEYSNRAWPSNFPGEFLMFAPGGGNGTGITSSVNHGSLAASYSGTSQAAPHVAGFYALVKAAIPSLNVAQIASYIYSNPPTAAVGISATACEYLSTNCVSTNFRRIRLP